MKSQVVFLGNPEAIFQYFYLNKARGEKNRLYIYIMIPFISGLTNKVLGRHCPNFPSTTQAKQQQTVDEASLSLRLFTRSEQVHPLGKKSKASEASLGRWDNPLEPELMKHPFWRGKRVKAIKITKGLIGEPSFYRVIEQTQRRQRHPQLRSPERGIKASRITHPRSIQGIICIRELPRHRALY